MVAGGPPTGLPHPRLPVPCCAATPLHTQLPPRGVSSPPRSAGCDKLRVGARAPASRSRGGHRTACPTLACPCRVARPPHTSLLAAAATPTLLAAEGGPNMPSRARNMSSRGEGGIGMQQQAAAEPSPLGKHTSGERRSCSCRSQANPLKLSRGVRHSCWRAHSCFGHVCMGGLALVPAHPTPTKVDVSCVGWGAGQLPLPLQLCEVQSSSTECCQLLEALQTWCRGGRKGLISGQAHPTPTKVDVSCVGWGGPSPTAPAALLNRPSRRQGARNGRPCLWTARGCLAVCLWRVELVFEQCLVGWVSATHST
jgi:hypothetical protein